MSSAQNEAEICRLNELDADLLRRIGSGYVSRGKYVVSAEYGESVVFTLRPVALDQPFVRTWEYSDSQIEEYRKALQEGLSFSACLDGDPIALAICTAREWNNTLWIEEFHVAEQFRGRGIGHRLMEAVIDEARDRGFRSVGLESQNTNMPALEFYRAAGFTIAGLDTSLYSNKDLGPEGEVGLFLKRPL